MQQSSPITLYQQALDAGGYQPDDVQRRAVARLETIYQALNQYQNVPAASASLRNRLGRLFGKPARRPPVSPVQGLYMWGGVGRGENLADGPVFPQFAG